MHPLNWRRSGVVVACLVGLALAARVPAADNTVDPKALDRYLYTNLRFVINHGVDLYNSRRPEECYDHFRQSLQDLVPVLSHHPEIQKTIKEGLEKAEKDPEWRARMAARATMPNPEAAPALQQKAFALRAVFNDVRIGLSPEPLTKPQPKTAALWDRLGGEAAVRKVVDDFVALAAADPKVDVTRGGKHKLDELAVDALKKQMVEFISSATGGPLRYTGKSMKEVHKGMGVTNEQFDAAGADLRKALMKNNVKPDAAEALLGILEATRKDVVEGKTTGDKASGDDATVRGKVTLDGKPLAKGTVTLRDMGGKAFSTTVAADGTYVLDRVPPGAYAMSVADNRNVPVKYADKNTTPLKFNVVKGTNQMDIALEGAK
jgi:hemoglobin